MTQKGEKRGENEKKRPTEAGSVGNGNFVKIINLPTNRKAWPLLHDSIV